MFDNFVASSAECVKCSCWIRNSWLRRYPTSASETSRNACCTVRWTDHDSAERIFRNRLVHCLRMNHPRKSTQVPMLPACRPASSSSWRSSSTPVLDQLALSLYMPGQPHSSKFFSGDYVRVDFDEIPFQVGGHVARRHSFHLLPDPSGCGTRYFGAPVHS